MSGPHCLDILMELVLDMFRHLHFCSNSSAPQTVWGGSEGATLWEEVWRLNEVTVMEAFEFPDKGTGLDLWTQANRYPHVGTSPSLPSEDCYYFLLPHFLPQNPSQWCSRQLLSVGWCWCGNVVMCLPYSAQGEPMLVSLLKKKRKIEKASMSQKWKW